MKHLPARCIAAVSEGHVERRGSIPVKHLPRPGRIVAVNEGHVVYAKEVYCNATAQGVW